MWFFPSPLSYRLFVSFLWNFLLNLLLKYLTNRDTLCTIHQTQKNYKDLSYQFVLQNFLIKTHRLKKKAIQNPPRNPPECTGGAIRCGWVQEKNNGCGGGDVEADSNCIRLLFFFLDSNGVFFGSLKKTLLQFGKSLFFFNQKLTFFRPSKFCCTLSWFGGVFFWRSLDVTMWVFPSSPQDRQDQQFFT